MNIINVTSDSYGLDFVLVRPHKHHTLVLAEQKQFCMLYLLLSYSEIFSEVHGS
jgi:hypothetical protein